MNMQSFLTKKQMTMYRLSKISGVPKSTVLDICSGKSDIGSCNARTVQKLAHALGCTMEDLMDIDTSHYDQKTGKPKDDSYLEKGLPPYLYDSITAMVNSWNIIDSGDKDLHWDIFWCNLNADINSAEVEQEISSEQAWYLRKKYLRMEQ